jgi:tripartite-type tricarboxylate transporter receptor subunit TctC
MQQPSGLWEKNMNKLVHQLGAFVAAGLILGATAVSAQAQSGADFFNGKTVNYIVTTDPGGGFDTYGRLVAQYMQKHLPGSTFVVRNMPGAGHMIGANYIYASEPDGLTIGTFNTGLIYSQLAEVSTVKFDLGKMSWIGKAAADPRMIVVSTQSGIDTIEQLMSGNNGRVLFTADGVASGSYVETLMLSRAAGLPVELVTGYDGGADQMSMKRGETQGVLSFRSSYELFVGEGNAKFLAQIGGNDPAIPQLADHVSEEAQPIIDLIASQGLIARLTAGPEGIPADRLEALQQAYAAALSDPEFLEAAAKLKLPINPMVGDEVGEAVRAALDQSPETIAMLKELLNK